MPPTVPWGTLLQHITGMVCLVEADGTLIQAVGQLWETDPDASSMTEVASFAHPGHRERLLEVLAETVHDREAHRVQVMSRRWEEGAFNVEIVPLEEKQLVLIWVPADDHEVFEDTDDAPTEGWVQTSLFADARAAYGSAAAPVDPDAVDNGPDQPRAPEALREAPRFVIVAPTELRPIAARLQRAIDLATTDNAVWFEEDFERNAAHLSDATRFLFLGSSRYARFLRRVAKARHRQLGARWSLMARKALAWVNQTERPARHEVEAALEQVLREVSEGATGPVTLLQSDHTSSGASLAMRFLMEAPTERPHVEDLQLVLAITTFLRDAWEEFRGDALD